jgi:hypothetical protein
VPADSTSAVDGSADLIVIDLQFSPWYQARILLYFLEDHVSIEWLSLTFL